MQRLSPIRLETDAAAQGQMLPRWGTTEPGRRGEEVREVRVEGGTAKSLVRDASTIVVVRSGNNCAKA